MIIDALDRIIQIKIVYFGPALSGKTTSLKKLFNHFGKSDDVKSIESSIGRTLFFDYGNISFQNDDWKLKIHVYSTTGQDFYIVTRPITLKAIDGFIFVVDSQKHAYERNVISWKEIAEYFQENLGSIPKIIAFNKQDVRDKFSKVIFLKEIEFKKLKNIDICDTIALNGEGILESFEKLLFLICDKVYGNQIILNRN